MRLSVVHSENGSIGNCLESTSARQCGGPRMNNANDESFRGLASSCPCLTYQEEDPCRHFSEFLRNSTVSNERKVAALECFLEDRRELANPQEDGMVPANVLSFLLSPEAIPIDCEDVELWELRAMCRHLAHQETLKRDKEPGTFVEDQEYAAPSSCTSFPDRDCVFSDVSQCQSGMPLPSEDDIFETEKETTVVAIAPRHVDKTTTCTVEGAPQVKQKSAFFLCSDKWAAASEYLQRDCGLQDHIELLRTLHDQGCQNVEVLASIGFLRQRDDANKYLEAVECIGIFLADPVPLDSIKFLVLQSLFDFDSRDALQFCLGGPLCIEQILNSELLWELRAICMYCIGEQQKRNEMVMEGVERASYCIVHGATLLGHGVRSTAAAMSTGMGHLSSIVVQNTEPCQNVWLQDDPKASIVATTYSGGARRATTAARVATLATVNNVRNVSSNKIRETKPWMPRNPNQKTAVEAVGTLGLATLGAVALVGEAVVSSTSEVVQGASQATSSVIAHKYGETAGQVVRDIGDTTGNVFRIAAGLTFFTGGGKVVAKSVAKNTCKLHALDTSQQKQNSTNE